MLVIPAIDLKDGHCVRLRQGDFQQETVYSENPAAMALHWQEQGAQWLSSRRFERCGRWRAQKSHSY